MMNTREAKLQGGTESRGRRVWPHRRQGLAAGAPRGSRQAGAVQRHCSPEVQPHRAALVHHQHTTARVVVEAACGAQLGRRGGSRVGAGHSCAACCAPEPQRPAPPAPPKQTEQKLTAAAPAASRRPACCSLAPQCPRHGDSSSSPAIACAPSAAAGDGQGRVVKGAHRRGGAAAAAARVQQPQLALSHAQGRACVKTMAFLVGRAFLLPHGNTAAPSSSSRCSRCTHLVLRVTCHVGCQVPSSAPTAPAIRGRSTARWFGRRLGCGGGQPQPSVPCFPRGLRTGAHRAARMRAATQSAREGHPLSGKGCP